MSRLGPPAKSYNPPQDEYMEKIKPPHHGYIPPQDDYLKTMKAPKASYNTPSKDYMKKVKPPNQGYVPPKNDYLKSMKSPSHGYIPPKSDYPKSMKTPSHGYIPPKSDYLKSMKSPKSLYSPPTKDYIKKIEPPHHGYIPPKNDYLKAMKPPKPGYVPPTAGSYVSTIKPPSYNSIKSTMSPPSNDYKPPPSAYQMRPPNKGYIPPVATHNVPPNKEYLPPPMPTKYSVPTKEYLPPKSTTSKNHALQHMGTMRPPSKEYSPPSHPDHMLHLTPPKYHSCPIIAAKSEEVCYGHQNQCWSPGVADLDCPGSGLCCFDGCVNICVHLHVDHFPNHLELKHPDDYHVGHHSTNVGHHEHKLHAIHYPPNIAFLSPGSVSISAKDIHDWRLLHGSASTPRSIEVDDNELNLPSETYLPPNYDVKDEHPLEDLVNYLPPSKAYNSPEQNGKLKLAKTYLPPSIDYKIPSPNPSFKPPTKTYLPPKVSPDIVSDAEYELMSMQPPVHEDHHEYKLPRTLFPPSKKGKLNLNYLPPSKTFTKPEIESLSLHSSLLSSRRGKLPKQSMSAPDYAYEPPSQPTPTPPSLLYSPPSIAYQTSGVSITIKPPINEKHGSPSAHHLNSYLPPEKEYKAPHVQYQGPQNVRKNEHLEHGHTKHEVSYKDPLKPPSKEYIPPHSTPSSNHLNNYLPPEKEYKAPHVQYQASQDIPKNEHLGHVNTENELSYKNPLKPPSKEYIPPPSDQLFTHMKPPTKEYLNAKRLHGDHFHPPSKEYLPPHPHQSGFAVHMEPPNKNYESPAGRIKGDYMHPPHKNYIPPPEGRENLEHVLHDEQYHHGAHMTPPIQDYKAPLNEISQVKAAKYGYKPPNKEYLPPPTNKQIKESLDILEHHLDILSANGEDLHPPNKEYLPPKINSPIHVDTQTLKEIKVIKDIFEHSSKTYIPPTKGPYIDKDVHHIHPELVNHPPAPHVHHDGLKMVPPSKEYLPPPNTHLDDVKNYKKGTLYQPPSKEYLPPAEVSGHNHDHVSAHHILEEGVGMKPPSREYLPPPGTVPRSVKDDHYQDHKTKMHPPSKEYLPPAVQDDLSTLIKTLSLNGISPKEVGLEFQLPSKEYLPPKPSHPGSNPSVEVGVGFHPPSHEYLPPTHDGKHVLPNLLPKKPKDSHGELAKLLSALDGEHHHHPKKYLNTKEYVLPNLLPEKHKTPEGAHYTPPNKEYLPPPHISPGLSLENIVKELAHSVEHQLPILKDTHDSSKIHDMIHFAPPSQNYLPPKDIKHNEVEAHVQEIKANLPHIKQNQPFPQINLNGNSVDVSSVSQDQPQTLVDHPNVQVIAIPDVQKPNHEPMLHIASPPHSINIQINIPNKNDDDNEKEKENSNEIREPHPPSHIVEENLQLTSYEGSALPLHHGPQDIHMPHMLPGHGHSNTHVPHMLPEHGDSNAYQSDLHQPHMLPEHDNNYAQMPHMLPPHDDLNTYMPHMLPPHDNSDGLHLDPLRDVAHNDGLPSYDQNDMREQVAAIAANLPSRNKDYPEQQYISHPTRLPPKQYHVTRHPIPPKQYFPTRMPNLDGLHENKPHKEYVVTKSKLGPKEYLPTDEYEKPEYDALELNDFPPKEYIPTKTEDTDLPIPLHYLPPSEEYKPPKKYFPTNIGISDNEEELPEPPAPEKIPALPDEESVEDFILNLETPSRGPQSPVPEELKSAKYTAPKKLKAPKYVAPPKRPVSVLKLEGANVPNSQANPVTGGEEYYIPPRTANDVPKNFIRPGEVEKDIDDPPPPEALPNLEETESFDRTPFLGLAKFTSSGDKEETIEKENKKPTGNKLEKLIQRPKPAIPPMPTVPPQPDTFLPLLESINPSLLQQLKQGILGQTSSTRFTTNGGSGSQGKIPGIPGKDYPDFKTIPNTEFSCENFILEGFYADTFTSCQVMNGN